MKRSNARRAKGSCRYHVQARGVSLPACRLYLRLRFFKGQAEARLRRREDKPSEMDGIKLYGRRISREPNAGNPPVRFEEGGRSSKCAAASTLGIISTVLKHPSECRIMDSMNRTLTYSQLITITAELVSNIERFMKERNITALDMEIASIVHRRTLETWFASVRPMSNAKYRPRYCQLRILQRIAVKLDVSVATLCGMGSTLSSAHGTALSRDVRAIADNDLGKCLNASVPSYTELHLQCRIFVPFILGDPVARAPVPVIPECTGHHAKLSSYQSHIPEKGIELRVFSGTVGVAIVDVTKTFSSVGVYGMWRRAAFKSILDDGCHPVSSYIHACAKRARTTRAKTTNLSYCLGVARLLTSIPTHPQIWPTLRLISSPDVVLQRSPAGVATPANAGGITDIEYPDERDYVLFGDVAQGIGCASWAGVAIYCLQSGKLFDELTDYECVVQALWHLCDHVVSLPPRHRPAHHELIKLLWSSARLIGPRESQPVRSMKEAVLETSRITEKVSLALEK